VGLGGSLAGPQHGSVKCHTGLLQRPSCSSWRSLDQRRSEALTLIIAGQSYAWSALPTVPPDNRP